MTDAYLGQIKLFAGDFAPNFWAFCEGQSMTILDNQALYAVIGTTYGGDGINTFSLPDLRSKVPIHKGQGLALTNRQLGEFGGEQANILGEHNMPGHNHAVNASTSAANTTSPAGNSIATFPTGRGNQTIPGQRPYNDAGAGQDFDSSALAYSGGGQAHLNIQPVLGLHFIICLNGIFPN